MSNSLINEPLYTKGKTNTLFWTSGSVALVPVEFLIERSSTNSFYTDDITTNEGVIITDESHQTSGTRFIYATYSPESVQGVYLESDAYKINNYYTSGSGFVRNEIRLATLVSSENSQVLVDYTRSGWTTQDYDTHFNLIDTNTYYYRLKVKNIENSMTSGSFYVFSTQDDKIDELKIISPTGKEFWRGGTTREVLWEAVDNDSGISDADSLIEYSRDSGITWNTLVSGSIIPSENIITNEQQNSVNNHRIYTNYDIKSITSIYPIGIGSGTNWYYHPLASGSNFVSGKEIYLTYPLPSDTTPVQITYTTYGIYNWLLPTTLDSNNWRLKFTVKDKVENTRIESMTDDFTIMTPIDRLTDIFKKEEDTNTASLLNTFGDSIDDNNDNTVSIENNLYYNGSYGADLDGYATSMELTRYTNEPDYELRERIKHETRIADTKLALIDYLDLYSTVNTNDLIIDEWVGGNSDENFFLNYSYLDYTDRMTSGTNMDPFSFDVWIRPLYYDSITYRKIADAITKTRPVSTTAYVRILSGEAYGSFTYGTGHKYGASTF